MVIQMEPMFWYIRQGHELFCTCRVGGLELPMSLRCGAVEWQFG